MKTVVYNQQGEKIEEILLPKEIFDVKFNSDLVHQVVVSQTANRRRVIAHTKDRGEVRGGGRKPWRQKGTGRARHGSIRSPIWRGGGVTFGPTKQRVFKKEIPKKMRKKALFMVLSAKKKNESVILLDKLELKKAKTKEAAEMIKVLRSKIETFKQGSILVILPEMDKNIILSFRNIPKIKTIQAKDLNCLDILTYKYLIILKEAIKVIKDTFCSGTARQRSFKPLAV